LSAFKTNTLWLGEIFEGSKSAAIAQQARKLFTRYTKSYVYPFYLVLTIPNGVCLVQLSASIGSY